VKLVTAHVSVAVVVDPNASTPGGDLVSAQTPITISIKLIVLVLEATSTHTLEHVGSTIVVEVVIAPGGFHHVVGVLYRSSVITTSRIGENQGTVLTALMSGTLIQVDPVTVGTASAKPVTASTPEVASPTHMNIFARLMKLTRWSVGVRTADSLISWEKIYCHFRCPPVCVKLFSLEKGPGKVLFC